MIEINPPSDPWALFADWFAAAKQQEPTYPDAMMLATVGDGGMPSVRAVLVKSFDAQGVVFHTNRQSRKARDMTVQQKAAGCFYWKSLQRQIRLEGLAALISDAESDAYFATRPRGSQIGAWASQQSRPLDSRSTLETRIAEFEKKYQGQAVPRPPHWGGYRLAPSCFEFWQEEPRYRLHDRIAYRRAGESAVWTIERLYP